MKKTVTSVTSYDDVKKLMTKKTSVTFNEFTDFGDFIRTMKKIKDPLERKIKQPQQDMKAAKMALSKIPDLIWQRAEAAGLITINPLKWIMSKALFAYFVEVACDKYNISKVVRRKGLLTDKIRDLKPFEKMFGIDDLKGKIKDYKKDDRRGKPRGHQDVDKIFEK